MVRITNTSQLDTFSIVRTILLANSIIAKRFTFQDFFEFEPNHKANSFQGFPYVLIKVPELESEDQYLGEIVKNKMFVIDILLRMDYFAKENFTKYASNIIKELEASNSTFQASGYDLESVEFEGVEPLYLDERQIVEGSFTLTLQGEVEV